MPDDHFGGAGVDGLNVAGMQVELQSGDAVYPWFVVCRNIVSDSQFHLLVLDFCLPICL